MNRKHVIVVGGGVGGLSAAIRLAARGGVGVTLVEKNPRVGGKLNLWEAPHPHRPPGERSFRFDTGPSLLTLPFVLADLFAAAGEDVRKWLPILKLDPIASFRWVDGTRFDLRDGSTDLEAELARVAPGDVAGWKRFAERGRQIWDLSAELFLFHAPEQVLSGKAPGGEDRKPWSGLALLTTPFRIGMFSRYSRLVDKHLQNQKLREVLYQYATYSGASPFKAPATLAVIPHAETYFGGWYPQGGMYQIADALRRLAEQSQVTMRTGVSVERILCERDGAGRKARRRAIGVRLSGGEVLRADAVVVNADVVYAYRHLIDPADRPHWPEPKLDRLEPGGSGMVLLLGVEGTCPQLAHHTKFMPADYASDLRAMFDTRTIPADPCIYVCASTRTDPSQAPEGCENLFVLTSAPPLDGRIDWAVEGPRYEQQVIDTLEHRWGLTDLARRIVVRRRFTPVEFRSVYNANAGSIYGIGSNSRRTAFLRPPNRDRKIAGLYFAGGATHPGGGLPLVTLSGKIAAELVAEDLGLA